MYEGGAGAFVDGTRVGAGSGVPVGRVGVAVGCCMPVGARVRVGVGVILAAGMVSSCLVILIVHAASSNVMRSNGIMRLFIEHLSYSSTHDLHAVGHGCRSLFRRTGSLQRRALEH